MVDLTKPLYESSFLSCEKDAETILKKLFFSDPEYANLLKRLLVISTKDCISDLENEDYINKINEMNISKLVEEGYIRLQPKIRLPEHEKIKSYIILTFDNFVTNQSNPQFRDCVINIDVICHTDYWDIGDYRQRPLKIVGYIDSLLNNSRLSGIGLLQFFGCGQLILDENLSGYNLSYLAVHGGEDRIKDEE